MSDKEYLKKINKVSVITLIGNIFLSLVKLLAGVFAFSSALVSDAVNSLSDCFSTVVAFIGVRISSKKSDKEHPYGHERMECVTALLLAALLLGSAFLIIYQSINSIVEISAGATVTKPELPALIVALFCVLFKGGMFLYAKGQAKKLNSSVLHGYAVDHLSDALSSFGAAVGIVGAMCGVAVLDPIASLLIGVMIVKAAWDICRIAVNQLVDKAANVETEKEIADAVLASEGVERIDVLRTRQYGNKIFVDLEIAVCADLSLVEAHKIAERVHARVEHEIGGDIKHCMVHVNPLTGEDNHEPPQEEML